MQARKGRTRAMSDQRELEGLTALVTGATSGIGRAAAEQLARRGADVIVHGRDAARGAAVAGAITGAGDVLVNNAGFSWIGPTAELDVATFDRLYAANVRAPYFLVAALAPIMAGRGNGSIVNVGSQSGQIGMAGLAADSATKGALAALTRSWAAEFSPAGVRINTVVPGPVYTRIRPDSVTQAVGATTLLARAAQPDEIASVIVFLASPEASYITGAVLAADGGRTAV